MLRLFVLTAAATVALMLSVWGLSLIRRDASIVDVFWGLGFALIALVSFQLGHGYAPRRQLVLILTGIWGLRLALYLLWRNWGAGEDFRYRTLRERYGKHFGFVSLFLVFGLQGALMWLVSLPIQLAAWAPLPDHWTWLDAVGVSVWTIGFLFESIGDWQLARFKADPMNRGKVMDRGLWGYTRHPNYFGDATLWWGIFVTALATPGGIFVIFSPLLMTAFLMKVSGVPLLERKLTKTRPKYRDYVQRTNAFVPWFPRAPAR